MISNITDRDIYVKPGPTDMRKQTNGLSVIVQEWEKSSRIKNRNCSNS